MSAVQKELYLAILKKELVGLGSPMASMSRLQNIMMQLRKCTNHPYLFHGVEPEPFREGEHLVPKTRIATRFNPILTPF